MKPRNLILLILSLVVSKLFATNADSLIKSVKYLPEKEQYAALANHFNDLYETEPEEAIKIGQYLLTFKGLKEKPDTFAKLQNSVASAYFYLGKNNDALELYNAAYKIYVKLKNVKGQANILTNIASVYNNKGEYQKALDQFYKALKIHDQRKDTLGLSLTYYNIATAYYYLVDYKTALNYYNRGLDEALLLKDTLQISNNLSGIGMVYWGQNKYTEALSYYSKARVLMEKIGHEYGLLYLFNNLAAIYSEMEKPDEALAYYIKTIKLATKAGDRDLISVNYLNLGDIYVRKKQYQSAIEEYLNGYYLSDTVLDNKLRKKEACVKLMNAYYKIGKYKEAFEYSNEAMILKDTLINEQRDGKISELNALFEAEKKEKEIALLQASKKANELELLLRESSISKQKRTIIIIAIVLLASIIIGILILNRYKLKQRAFRLLEIKNDKINTQKELIEEKQKEILDSIYYAKRIQQSLMPTDKYLGRNINKLKNPS